MSFQKFAKDRLARELWNGLEWADVVLAFQGTSVDERNKFMAAIKSRRVDVISRAILSIIERKIDADVQAEYDQITADGNLSQSEIQRLFGEN